MGYINKYKGFIIPEKGIFPDHNPMTNIVVLRNPTLNMTIGTDATVDEYHNFTDSEYQNFIKECKSTIDEFMLKIDEQEEEKRNRHR